MTISKKICQPWNKFSSFIKPTSFSLAIYPENYCRKLLDPYGAWCFVKIQSNIFEKHYCEIESCSGTF